MKLENRGTEHRRDSSDTGGIEDDADKHDKRNSRRVTAVACLSCQRRKGKCDGKRPACTACRGRAAICVYETADGLTRSADLKQKNQILMARAFELEHVLQRLRSEDDVQSSNTLARLRLGDNIQDIVRENDYTATGRDGSSSNSKRPRTSQKSSAERSSRSLDMLQPVSVASASSPSPSRTVSNETIDSRTRKSSAQNAWLLPLWTEDVDPFQRSSLQDQVSTDNTRMIDLGEPSQHPQTTSGDTSFGQHSRLHDQHTQSFMDANTRTPRSIASLHLRAEGDSLDICTQYLDSKQARLHTAGASNPQWSSSSQKTATTAVPLWAVLPKHRPAEDSINLAYMSFLQEKRYIWQSGSSVQSPFGTYPVIDVLFSERQFAAADDVSKWAGRLASTYFSASFEQIICFWSSWHVMRWMIAPSPETFEAMPEWLRPIPQQLFVPHNISNDFLAWPRLREAIIGREEMQRNSEWLIELGMSLSCNWDRSIEEALYRDGESGVLALNPSAIEHVGNMGHWTVGPKFRAWLPNVDQYVRVKYDADE